MTASFVPSAALFTAQALACRRGERLLFRQLSFELPPATALVLTGPNGSGKSSLLRLLAGLARPLTGQVSWSDGGETVARVAFLGHQEALKGDLTLAENLAFVGQLYGTPVVLLDAALRRWGLLSLAKLPVRVLSAGQRRRAALARLLLQGRELWLLDEPTTALDSDSVACFEAQLAEHLAAGGRAVLATHQPLTVTPRRELALAAVVAWEAA